MAMLEESIKQDKLVVTLYYATWSAPSKVMYDSLLPLSKAHPGVMFLKVDIDESKDITMRMGVRIVPTTLFVQKGKEVYRTKSVVSADIIEQKMLSCLQA